VGTNWRTGKVSRAVFRPTRYPLPILSLGSRTACSFHSFQAVMKYRLLDRNCVPWSCMAAKESLSCAAKKVGVVSGLAGVSDARL
jgi:hypothetical protein